MKNLFINRAERTRRGATLAGSAKHNVFLQNSAFAFFESFVGAGIHTECLFASSADEVLACFREGSCYTLVFRAVIVIRTSGLALFAFIADLKIHQKFFHILSGLRTKSLRFKD